MSYSFLFYFIMKSVYPTKHYGDNNASENLIHKIILKKNLHTGKLNELNQP